MPSTIKSHQTTISYQSLLLSCCDEIKGDIPILGSEDCTKTIDIGNISDLT